MATPTARISNSVRSTLLVFLCLAIERLYYSIQWLNPRAGTCMKDCWAQRFHANASSWPCVTELVSRVSPSAVTVAEQASEGHADVEEAHEWAQFIPGLGAAASSSNVRNFAMNSASMMGEWGAVRIERGIAPASEAMKKPQQTNAIQQQLATISPTISRA